MFDAIFDRDIFDSDIFDCGEEEVRSLYDNTGGAGGRDEEELLMMIASAWPVMMGRNR